MGMDYTDVGLGLIGGLQQGLLAYQNSSDKRKDRELQAGMLQAEKGLIQDPNNPGKFIIDPGFKKVQDAEAMRSLKDKALLEGRNLQLDDSGNVISANRTPEEIAFQQMKLKKDKADKNGGVNLTPGEKKADEAYGKQYQDYNAGGGESSVQQNINQLESAVEDLKKPGEVSGGWTTKVPILNSSIAQDIINPEKAQIKNKIYSAVQGTVKQLLPGAISDYESKSILERAYNDRLSDAQNIENATREINKLKAKAEQMKASSDYFADQGTLKGFKQPRGLIGGSDQDTGGSQAGLIKQNAIPQRSAISPGQAGAETRGPKPKSVIQNGHTYNLNEQTGQYE